MHHQFVSLRCFNDWSFLFVVQIRLKRKNHASKSISQEIDSVKPAESNGGGNHQASNPKAQDSDSVKPAEGNGERNHDTSNSDFPGFSGEHLGNAIGSLNEKMRGLCTQKKKRTAREEMPKNAIRFDGFKHYLEYNDPSEDRKGFRCKLCGMQSSTFCTKCNVHLCFVRERGGKKQVRNCFRSFHEINEC